MSFFYNISNYIYKKLDDWFRKDYLWEQTKRRIFFKKLLHLFYYIIICYFVLSYLDYVISNRTDLSLIGIHADIKLYYQEDYEKMFINIFSYLVVWFFVYLISFFVRKIHEVIYQYWYVLCVWSYLYLMFNNYGLWILSLTYTHYLTFAGCLILTLYHYWANLAIVSHTDNEDIDDEVSNQADEEDDVVSFEDEILVEENREYIAEVIERTEQKERLSNWFGDLEKKKVSYEFTGDLHAIPSIYGVDPKVNIQRLMNFKRQRFEDEQEFGITDMIQRHGKLLKLYVDETVTQNYVLNIKRILGLINYFVMTERDSGETFIEFHARYEQTQVLQEAKSREDLDDLTDEDKLRHLNDKFEVKKIYLDPWYSSLWLKNMNSTEALWYTWWTSNQVPFLVKIFVIISRFLKEYWLGLLEAKASGSVLFFSDAFYSFFGIKRKEEKFVIKLDNGYLAWVRGQPRIVDFDSPDFDPELYATPINTLTPIHIQFLNIFKSIFNVFKSIFVFVYYLLTSWGSIAFWVYAIKSSIYFHKFVIFLILRLYEISFEILKYFFGRFYGFVVKKLVALFYLITGLLYYFLIVLRKIKILYRGVKPAGPYSLYNSFINKNIRYIYLRNPIMFIEREKDIRKTYKLLKKNLRKSKKRELFLLWSSSNVN